MDVESGQQCHKKSSCVPIRRSVQCEITKYSWSNGSQLLWLRPKSKAKTSNNVGMEKAAASLFEALGCTRMVQRSLCVCVCFFAHTPFYVCKVRVSLAAFCRFPFGINRLEKNLSTSQCHLGKIKWPKTFSCQSGGKVA